MINFKTQTLLIILSVSCLWLYLVVFPSPKKQERQMAGLYTDFYLTQEKQLGDNYEQNFNHFVETQLQKNPLLVKPFKESALIATKKAEKLIQKTHWEINKICDCTPHTKDLYTLSKRKCIKEFIIQEKSLIQELTNEMQGVRGKMFGKLSYIDMRLSLDEDLPKIDIRKERFEGTSVAGARLVLSQYRHMLRAWEKNTLVYLANRAKQLEPSYDYLFEHVIEEKIIPFGDTTDAVIYHLPYPTYSSPRMKVFVNGDVLTVTNGMADYELPTDRKGDRILEVDIEVKPLYAKEPTTYHKTFNYQVK